MLKQAFWVAVTLLQLHASVLAFHPEDFTSDAPLQCLVCNSSYYCSNGTQYACPRNSKAILYADVKDECVCNPGYLKPIPPIPVPRLQFFFRTDESPYGWWEAYNEAVAVGRRLPTIDELRAYIASNPEAFAAFDQGQDRWTPVINPAAGDKRDYVQIGTFVWNTICCGMYYRGLSLIAHRPWPSWADSSSEPFLQVYTEVLETLPPSPFSWDACELGQAPFWYLYGQKNSCPATKGVAAHGSGSAEDCVCLPGSYSQANRSSPCLPCPPGTFADKHNMSQCTPCPANSWHDKTNQTNISVCLCNAGWAGVAANGCVECAAGSFSPVNGSAVCQVCRNNSDTFLYPRTACQCRTGFFGIGTSPCIECPQHTWADEVGLTECKSCKVFLQSPGGATQHTRQTSSDSCFCLPGYLSIVIGGARACQACAPGTFHVPTDDVRNESCQNCSYGTYASSSAATVCTNCPVNATTYVFPYTACQCHSGYLCQTYPQLTWEQIGYGGQGSWAFSNFNENTMLNIQYDNGGYGTWRNTELVAFWKQFNVDIPTPTTQNPNPAWSGIFLIVLNQLPECLTDFSNHPCKLANRWHGGWFSYSNYGGLMVFKFYMVYYPVRGISYSVHAISSGPYPTTARTDGFQWLQCAAQFSTHIGCLPFDGNPNNLFTGNRPNPSPLFGIQKMLKQDPATCPDGSCVACPVNTFKSYTGPAKECTSCQSGGVAQIASIYQSQCNCSAGYFRQSNVSCPSCANGYYSLTQDVLECTKCPEHTFTDPALHPWNVASDCRVCKLCNTSTNAAFTDHYDAARGGVGCGESSVEVCTQCPSLSSLFLPTTESQRNFGVRSCVCDQNSYGLVGTACTACPVGQNRTGFIYDNTTLKECQCLPGYEPDPAAANLCRQCPIGTYKPELGDHNCSVCPDTFTTEVTGKSKFSDCVCKPGYSLSTEQVCVICPENTHKEGFNLNTTCNACTANSFGAAGGTGPSECSCLQGFDNNADVCNKCTAGKYKNSTIKLGTAATWTYIAAQEINLARACSAGGCPVTAPSAWDAYPRWKLVDGNNGKNYEGIYHSADNQYNPWVMIDLEHTMSIKRVRIYNWWDYTPLFENFEIRIGDSSIFSDNPLCGSREGGFGIFKDFTCVFSGRYVSVQRFHPQTKLVLQEIEVYGAKVPADERLYKCVGCPQNTFTNNTGVLGCDACAVGKTTDGRIGQVECVCDVGTFLGANGTCQTCPESSFKATTTDKYANRGCVTCSSCAANQQVNTECNSTHDITCRACQANSWSSAGRKLLDPCFCNAGYELQGEICVACPVGKARKVNNDNSIVCETCADQTFTSVSTTVSCKTCSPICGNIPPFTKNLARTCTGGNCPVTGRSMWINTWGISPPPPLCCDPGNVVDGDLATQFRSMEGRWYGNNPRLYGDNEWVVIDLQRSKQVTMVRIYTNDLSNFEIRVGNQGITGSGGDGYGTIYTSAHQSNPACATGQPSFSDVKDFACILTGRYVSVQQFNQQVLSIREIEVYGTDPSDAMIGYVKQECNASRDVICQKCQTCEPGFYANNTCSANYSNNRLDTQCVSCPENAFCPGTATLQQPLLCSEQRCGANQQVATLCNTTHNITCKACQANSWSYAGRTLLDPCFCNAGYELQGELCVACPVGKARQANANNSIRCEVCAAGTFTSVSTTVSCEACSPICDTCVQEAVYDFSPYNDFTSWKNYAASIGAKILLPDWAPSYNGICFLGGNPEQTGWIELQLPNQYNYVTVYYGNTFHTSTPPWGTPVRLLINGVVVQAAPAYTYQEYSQTYTSVTVLRIDEQAAVIGKNIKITLRGSYDCYVQAECNASRNVICQECQKCKPGFYANNTCGTNYSNDRLDTQCVSCPEEYFCPGTATLQQPLLCSEQRCVANQQVATLCNTTHNITCKACQPNSWSYAGRTELGPCLCNSGYELQGQLCVACPVGKARQANNNNSIMCETCGTQTFTSVSTTISCGACSSICTKKPAPQYDLVYDCPAYGNCADYDGATGCINSFKTCLSNFGATTNAQLINNGGLQASGSSQIDFPVPAGYTYVTVLYINSFYAGEVYLLINGVTVGVAPASSSSPQWRTHSQSITTPTTITLLEYNGVIGKSFKITLSRDSEYYVKHECNASRDVICQECQTCGPGFFANNTCGTNYSNDRLDTQCVPCPAGSYCPTGSGPPILCPDNGKSPLGSDDLKDCDCDPGYFRDLDGCSLCHFDFYCLGKQIQYAIACPPDSRTARRGSTSRVDCHCHTGYFRDPPERLDSFNCSLCLPGDFCFNNSAYNCSDALMVSAPGSGFFDNCTCVSGYYNNGTVCEDCPANYYCEGGKRLSCPANEWTAYEGRSYECVCMPGFYRNQDLCVPCTDNYFCEGLDDSREACPSNSVSMSAIGIQDCLCNVSYGAVFSTNVSEPHFCQLCAHTQTFKSTVGNSPCLQCTECLPHLHSAWTQIECTTRADALCDTCTVCYNASEGTPRSQYTTQACEQFFDTECANCSACNWTTEFELIPCSETDDATCSPITYNRQCPIGFYAGGHTRTSDSQCLPCEVRNTQYEGQWLHEFTSAGRQYNNSFSCELQCRPYSRLINNSDPSLGCTTCEVGNVLFKIFTQDTFACKFICLEGYVPVNGDCVLAAAEGNELTFWNHSLNVTHVRREEQRSNSVNHSGVGAFLVTVSHTSHGHFAVVVGPTEPSCSGRSQATLSKTALSACCFGAQWRVSTANQLGLPSQANETCSRNNAPWSQRLGETQLQFEIPDTRLQELGNCNIFEEVISCVLQISIVDIILLQHFTVPLHLEVTRSSALAITSTETYVPLSGIRVEAQLAYREANGSLIFVITTDMTPLAGAGNTDVLIFATGLDLVQPSSDINCARLAVGNVSNISTNFWTLKAEYVRTLTFFRVMNNNINNKGSVFIKLFYTLRLVERESTSVKNTMHIAAWRNVSTEYPVCEEYIQSKTVLLGQVLSCSGLGESVVAAATALSAPTDSVHGEVGGLTSFVARSLHEHVRTVLAKYMLLAFTLPPVVLHSNITEMRMGTLEFTEAFKAECTLTSFCHFRYAQQGNGMHFMTSCDVAAQNAARVWLRLALGVVHDDGHVTQLCRLSQWQQGQEYAFLITLVNTRAYLPQAQLWHDLQNRSSLVSTSNVFALFEFV